MNRNIQAKAEKDIQNKLESAPLRHSQLAMSAAKRMPRARKKERVGRVVCHHLLQMLASETPVAVNQASLNWRHTLCLNLDLQQNATIACKIISQ